MTIADRLKGGFALGVLALGVGVGLLCGCRPGAATKPAILTNSARADDALESARDTLRKQVGIPAYRKAVQDLNAHLSAHPDQRPASLTAGQRDFLSNRVGLDEDELAEVAGGGFTTLDVHYLDLCLLFRDAARSFDDPKNPPLQRAEAAFGWVCRQVRLQEQRAEALPPHFVLRRGWGTSLERSYVFRALLQQLGLEGCMVCYPVAAENSSQKVSVLWLPGVLIGNDIFLFDTRLGMPFPGPKGEGVATLAQVRTQPDLFAVLQVDDKHHYDVTPEQARQAEVLLTWPLPALAPRMRVLENLLGAANPVKLAVDVEGVQGKFAAAAGQNMPVRVDNRLRDFNNVTQLRLLRRFLPPGQGGTDPSNRMEQAEGQLIPWGALPTKAFQPPFESARLVVYLREAFQKLFVAFPLPEPRNQPLQEKDSPVGIARDPDKTRQDVAPRFVQAFLDPKTRALEAPASMVHFSQAPRSPRDDLLRGRFDDATRKLVEVQEQVRYQKDLAQSDPDLNQKMEQWFVEAVKAQADLQRARRQNPPNPGELEAAEKRLGELWLGAGNLPPTVEGEERRPVRGPVRRFPVWLVFVLGRAADPMGAEATYLLALAKHERAERAQARLARTAPGKTGREERDAKAAWRTAEALWGTYLENYPNAPGAAAARQWRARALEALGDSGGAVGLLENLAGRMSPLEETGRLYRAKQLKKG